MCPSLLTKMECIKIMPFFLSISFRQKFAGVATLTYAHKRMHERTRAHTHTGSIWSKQTHAMKTNSEKNAQDFFPPWSNLVLNQSSPERGAGYWNDWRRAQRLWSGWPTVRCVVWTMAGFALPGYNGKTERKKQQGVRVFFTETNNFLWFRLRICRSQQLRTKGRIVGQLNKVKTIHRIVMSASLSNAFPYTCKLTCGTTSDCTCSPWGGGLFQRYEHAHIHHKATNTQTSY